MHEINRFGSRRVPFKGAQNKRYIAPPLGTWLSPLCARTCVALNLLVVSTDCTDVSYIRLYDQNLWAAMSCNVVLQRGTRYYRVL